MYVPSSHETEQSKDAIVHDRFDTTVYEQTRTQFEPLQQVSSDQRLMDAPTFSENAFMSFYKAVPSVREDEQLTLTGTLHKRILSEMAGTAEYHKVRTAGSALDPYSSAIATAAVTMRIVERLDRATQQRMRRMQQAEQEAEQLRQNAQNLAQLAGHAQGPEQQQMQAQAQQMQNQAAQKQAQAQEIYNEIDAQGESLEDAVRRASRQGLEEAEKDIESMDDAMDTFNAPGTSQGTGTGRQTGSMKEKILLSHYLKRNKKLALIAKLAGRMKSAALDKQKNRVLHPPDEVVGIETGNDLSKMLSSEMYMLGDPLLEMLFYQKYTDKALLQWEMVGHEPEHKGPIICVIDGSGSMGSILTVSGDTNITKEVWSKAVAIGGLFEIARRQRRDFALMQFGAHGDLKTFHFPWKIRATMEEIILAADFFFDSGDTTFEEWMQEAPKLAEQSVYEKADLVIIGDGLAYIRPETLERYNEVRKAKQMHAQGILLARPGEIADGIEALESVVDKDAAGKPRVITISDLNEDADALDMMFSL